MGKYIYTGAPVEVRQVAGRGEENRVNWNYKQKERHQKEIETEVKKEQEIEKRKKKREKDAKKERKKERKEKQKRHGNKYQSRTTMEDRES